MKTESPHMRSERGQRRGAADVGYPWTRGKARRDLGNRLVWHAQQHEIRVASAGGQTAFLQPGIDGRADAAKSDNLYPREHAPSVVRTKNALRPRRDSRRGRRTGR